MKILTKVILGLVLVLTTNTFGQEYKFGKVSKEELLESSYPLDSSVNAAVLYESKRMYYIYNRSERGFRLVTEVFKRVKLYNKLGFKHGTIDFLLYKNVYADEKVSNLKGITFNLEGNKVIKTKLGKEGEFIIEYSENYDQHKFTMPNLKEGSIIDYKYKITSPFIYNLGRIYLQKNIPIKKIEVKVESPEYFNFKQVTTGYLPINFKKNYSNGQYVYLPRRAKLSNVLNSGNRPSNSSKKPITVNYKIDINSIVLFNVPAFKSEPYSGNANNYVSSIKFELQTTEFNNRIRNYATTWEDVIKRIYDRASFGEELKKNNYYKEDLGRLLIGVNDPERKTILVYEYLKEKMTWNGRYSVYTRKGVKKAYKENMGNVAEINIMLTSMLSSVGVDANPVLISTKDKVTPLFPTLNGFNYVITRVKLPDGEVVYLDATDKYGVPNVLSERVLQGAARIIADNGTSQNLNLRPYKPSESRSRMQYQINDEGIVKGNTSIYHFDYLAHDFRVRHGGKDKETQVKRIKKNYEFDDLKVYELKGVNELGKPISERFEFILENEIEVVDNEMFFSPLLFLSHKENVFKSDDRKYPVDFGHGFSNMYMVNIKIPEGYEVIELPESGGFKLPDDMGSFSFNSKLVNGMIQISVTETINSAIILPRYYHVIKEYYNQIIQKESDQVVLKKI